METSTLLSIGKNVGLTEEQRKSILQIKKWATMICRKKCIDSNMIFVSPYSYEGKNGEIKHKTVICISDNLPNGPVIQIPKALTEIGIEDLLSCYKLINYCKG